MNRQPILDSWASGELFGISEQFARGGIELSGISGWFALAPGQLSGISGYLPPAPAAQILPRGDRPRHATSELADATGELSRRPDHPAEPPSQSAGLTGRLAGRPGGLAGRPGESSRRPSQSSRRPGESDGRPSEPDGPGAARREGMDGARTGMDGTRRPGEARRGGAVFVPEGRWDVATGGASRSDAEPVEGIAPARVCPGGAEGSNDRVMVQNSSAPAGAGITQRALSTGCVGEAPTSPVATPLDPSGVGRHGHARAIGARARAGGRLFSAGEVPEGRPAPLASADLHAGGSGVRRVY